MEADTFTPLALLLLLPVAILPTAGDWLVCIAYQERSIAREDEDFGRVVGATNCRNRLSRHEDRLEHCNKQGIMPFRSPQDIKNLGNFAEIVQRSGCRYGISAAKAIFHEVKVRLTSAGVSTATWHGVRRGRESAI